MTSTSSLLRRPNRSPLLRWRVASERFLQPARQSPRKPAVKPSGRLMFKPGRLAVRRAPSTANSRTCHHEPSTRPSPACARSSVLTRKQPPIQPKSTVLVRQPTHRLRHPCDDQGMGVTRGEFTPALAAGLFGMGLGSVLAGYFADRFGRRMALIGSVFLLGCATCTIGASQNVPMIAVL